MANNKFCCDCNAVHDDLVEHALQKMPREDVFSAVSMFYKILGDATRCKIIFALMEQELCVCDISKILNMTKSAVSHQLSKMRDSGVVKCRRSGKEVYYSLDDDHVREIFAVTVSHVQHRISGV